MHHVGIKHYLTLSLKTVLSYAVFLFFLLYTPTIYGMAVDFIEESFFDSRNMVVGDKLIEVKVVKDPVGRIKGLSGRESLEENQGMFFIFDTVDFHDIWMKDMKFAIDIIWFNEFGSVVDIKENISPDTYPDTFIPQKPSKYILEVNAGFVKRYNLKIGDSIDLY